MAKSVAINVGANTNSAWGGFRGPIFSDGSFEFIHIPWKDDYGTIDPPPKRYSEMPYAAYVLDNMKDMRVLVSPDFDNCAYASTMGAPANKPILSLAPRDYLLFYATLHFVGDMEAKEEWINPDWGAYLIGLFEIDAIYESIYHILPDDEAVERFKDYVWFRIQLEDPSDWETPWVKGVLGKSGLLEKAIPLSRPDNSQRWSDTAYQLFRTPKGKRLDINKKAVFQTILTSEGDQLDQLLYEMRVRKNK